MDHTRILTVSVMSVCAGLFAIASCTRVTDRVLEPVGGGDASTNAPAVGDASVTPIGPIAHPATPTSPLRQKEQEDQDQPSQDFRLARSPELGVGLGLRTASDVHFADRRIIKTDNGLPGPGGAAGAAGSAGNAGAPGPGRPVATGGAAYF